MDEKKCELCQESLLATMNWYQLDCRHRVQVCSDECYQAFSQLVLRRKQVMADLQRYKEQLAASIRTKRRKNMRLETIRQELERLYQLTP